jgi:hypothetical protein
MLHIFYHNKKGLARLLFTNNLVVVILYLQVMSDIDQTKIAGNL